MSNGIGKGIMWSPIKSITAVPEEQEIGAQLEKAVLREGQRLSNGTGKGSKQNLLNKTMTLALKMVVGGLKIHPIMTISSNNEDDSYGF